MKTAGRNGTFAWSSAGLINQSRNDSLWTKYGVIYPLLSCLLCPFSVHILTYISHKIVHLNDPSFGISFLCSLVQIPSLLFSSITPSFSCCLYYLLFPLPLFPSDVFLCSIVSAFLSFSVMFFTSK